MADFRQIAEARKILGSGEYISLEEIKDVYRKPAVKYHPDKCKSKSKQE